MKNSTSNILAAGAIALFTFGSATLLTATLYTEETVLDITVTEEQKARYEVIKWLISDDNRAEGRTYLMALAFIDKAMKNKGKPVRIFDHSPVVNSHLYLLNVIGNIINSHGDKGIGIRIDSNPPTITVYDITVTERK